MGKELLENVLRYYYENISEELFVENLNERLENLEKMKALALGIKKLAQNEFNEEQNCVKIKINKNQTLILKQDDYYRVYFEGKFI